MTQKSLAIGYQRAIQIAQKARQEASDLNSARDKRKKILLYLDNQAESNWLKLSRPEPKKSPLSSHSFCWIK